MTNIQFLGIEQSMYVQICLYSFTVIIIVIVIIIIIIIVIIIIIIIITKEVQSA
jgi:hypothetical protein